MDLHVFTVHVYMILTESGGCEKRKIRPIMWIFPRTKYFRFVLKTKIYENLLEYKKIICICFDLPLLYFLSAAWLTEMVNGNSFPYPVILLTIKVMTLSAHTSINTMHKAPFLYFNHRLFFFLFNPRQPHLKWTNVCRLVL